MQIRILSLGNELKTVDKIYPEIYIFDPSHSRVMQWLDVKTKQGLIQLKIPLSDEPNLGVWNIKLKEFQNHKSFLSTSFEVKKYVLPKFEVTLEHFPTISIDDYSFNVTVCAKYLFVNKIFKLD